MEFAASATPGLGDIVKTVGGRMEHVGSVRFVGNTAFAPGLWVGLELDYPGGKNDGQVDGVRFVKYGTL